MSYATAVESVSESGLTLRLAWERREVTTECALNQLDHLMRQAERAGLLERLTTLRRHKGLIHSQIAQYEEALRLFQDAYKGALQLRSFTCAAQLLQHIGLIHQWQGRLPLAQEMYHLAYEAAQQGQDSAMMALGLAHEAHVLLLLEAYPAALSRSQEAMLHWQQACQRPHRDAGALACMVYYVLTLSYLYNQQHSAAWEAQRHLLDRAQHQGALQLGRAYRVLGDLTTQAALIPADFDPNPDQHYGEAMQLFQASAATLELSLTRLCQAKSLAARQRRSEALALLDEAAEGFTRLKAAGLMQETRLLAARYALQAGCSSQPA